MVQTAAATLMGIDQPKVSALLNGRLANFSSERLPENGGSTESRLRCRHLLHGR